MIGRTGSGKTSFVQALYRLYPLEKGRIRIAGVEPRMTPLANGESLGPNEVEMARYRSMIALISQEPTLFLGTLRENLAVPGIRSDAELLEALERVQFIASAAEGPRILDFQIEERGRNLSAGERQLVCIARCLLQDAPVVVLDEATSAVDPQSERILTRATEEFFRGKTQLIIAHRLSTIRHCDRVLWLQDGQVRMIGTPEQILPEFEKARLSARISELELSPMGS